MVYNIVMFKVNVFEVKAKLSEYLERAARGERIVICRRNKPVAELRAIEDVRTDPRPVGPLPGRPTFEVPASFFEAMSGDELELWEGMASTDPLAAAPTAPSKRRHSKVAEKKRTYRASRRTGARRRS